MDQTVRDALRTIERALADAEPAPIRVVLLRTESGRFHRAGQIEGRPSLLTYEGCNLDDVDSIDVVSDLSSVSSDEALCDRCFGQIDSYDPERPTFLTTTVGTSVSDDDGDAG